MDHAEGSCIHRVEQGGWPLGEQQPRRSEPIARHSAGPPLRCLCALLPPLTVMSSALKYMYANTPAYTTLMAAALGPEFFGLAGNQRRNKAKAGGRASRRQRRETISLRTGSCVRTNSLHCEAATAMRAFSSGDRRKGNRAEQQRQQQPTRRASGEDGPAASAPPI